MISDISLSHCTYEACKEDFISFRNANRDTARDSAYFDWRYLNRPTDLKPIIVLAKNNEGVIIGGLSLIPHHYIINNTIACVGLLGDISVAKEWRRQGIAQKMFKYLSETEEGQKSGVSLVLPNEAASRPLAKANWRTISTMNRYVKLINVEERLKQLLRVPWLSKLIAFPVNFILKVLSLETYTNDIAGYRGAVVGEFDERFDVLWNDAKKETMIVGLRNKQYLTWRYSKHPLVTYQVFTLTDKSMLRGYIVFHHNNNSCYIDDIFFLGERKSPQYLFAYFLKHMRNTNTSDIMLSMNKNNYFDLKLSYFGFVKRPNNWRVMISFDESKDANLLRNGNRWFLTAGDKDT